jgi:hypothetical protein
MKMDAAGTAQLDFHVWMRARETLEHIRQDIRRVKVGGSERDTAGNIGRREAAARLVVDAQHRPGKLEQNLAVMCQAELAAVVVEQGAADQVFQPADLVGDRRLGTSDLPAGRRESAGIDDRDERSEQRDIEILVQ